MTVRTRTHSHKRQAALDWIEAHPDSKAIVLDVAQPTSPTKIMRRASMSAATYAHPSVHGCRNILRARP